jgi:hypothetical protein
VTTIEPHCKIEKTDQKAKKQTKPNWEKEQKQTHWNRKDSRKFPKNELSPQVGREVVGSQ